MLHPVPGTRLGLVGVLRAAVWRLDGPSAGVGRMEVASFSCVLPTALAEALQKEGPALGVRADSDE